MEMNLHEIKVYDVKVEDKPTGKEKMFYVAANSQIEALQAINCTVHRPEETTCHPVYARYIRNGDWGNKGYKALLSGDFVNILAHDMSSAASIAENMARESGTRLDQMFLVLRDVITEW